MSLGNLLLLLGLLVMLAGCLDNELTEGGPANIPTSDGSPPPLTFNNPNTRALQDLVYSFSVGTGLQGSILTIANLPSWAKFDSTSGVLSGSPTTPGVSKEISITVKTGEDTKVIGPFDITVNGDPFAEFAWHLANTGQSTYAGGVGIAGEDIKGRDALRGGYTGKGVRVAVSDTGPEIAHEDLKEGVLANTSKNYAIAAPYFGDPTTKSLDPEDAHGTAVMGIIGARAWNGLGGRGIAPEASLSGFNFIEVQNSATYLDQAGGDYDIFNQSWGPGFEEGEPVSYVPYFFNAAAYRAQINSGVTALRGGKGAIYVRSAGNDFYQTIESSNPFVWRSRSACMEEDNSNTQVVVVGALNARGRKSSYSSTGSCLWISGTGGEYGYNNPAFNAIGNGPAILTTDLSGCNRGNAATTSDRNDFNRGMLGNTNCNYTSSMNGTSSASPSVAGVIALILQANPALTYRDVRHILASTATQVDTAFRPFIHPLDPEGYANEPAWLTNGAGYKFHNWYGFGRVNAEAATTMAKNYAVNLGTLKETVNANGSFKYSSGALALDIPDNQPNSPVTDVLAVTETHVIEAVTLEVSINHPFTGDLGIELTSPRGTSSVLLNTNNAQNTRNLDAVVLVSNAFYGEAANGNWTIKVRDASAGDTGRLTNWKLKITGH